MPIVRVPNEKDPSQVYTIDTGDRDPRNPFVMNNISRLARGRPLSTTEALEATGGYLRDVVTEKISSNLYTALMALAAKDIVKYGPEMANQLRQGRTMKEVDEGAKALSSFVARMVVPQSISELAMYPANLAFRSMKGLKGVAGRVGGAAATDVVGREAMGYEQAPEETMLMAGGSTLSEILGFARRTFKGKMFTEAALEVEGRDMAARIGEALETSTSFKGIRTPQDLQRLVGGKEIFDTPGWRIAGEAYKQKEKELLHLVEVLVNHPQIPQERRRALLVALETAAGVDPQFVNQGVGGGPMRTFSRAKDYMEAALGQIKELGDRIRAKDPTASTFALREARRKKIADIENALEMIAPGQGGNPGPLKQFYQRIKDEYARDVAVLELFHEGATSHDFFTPGRTGTRFNYQKFQELAPQRYGNLVPGPDQDLLRPIVERIPSRGAGFGAGDVTHTFPGRLATRPGDLGGGFTFLGTQMKLPVTVRAGPTPKEVPQGVINLATMLAIKALREDLGIDIPAFGAELPGQIQGRPQQETEGGPQ